MKRLFLLCLMIPVTLFGQNNQRYLTGAVPEVGDKVVFSKTIQAPALSKKQLFETMASWAESRYNQEKSRVVYQSPEEGAIACMGSEYIVFTSTALSLDRTLTNYMLRIICTDQKCELQISNIRFEYNVAYQKEPEKYRAEEWITDKYALTKDKSKLQRISGKFRKGTVDLVDKLFSDATNAINGQIPASASTQQPTVAEQKANIQEESNKQEIRWNGYKLIAPDKIQDNILKLMQNDCMLLTINEGQKTNLIPCKWGGMGFLFNKHIAFCVTGSDKNIASSLENADSYTLSFYKENYCDAINKNKPYQTMDNDKLNNTGLSVLKTTSGNSAFNEAWIIIECKKSPSLKPTTLQDPSQSESTLYGGEILNIWIK